MQDQHADTNAYRTTILVVDDEQTIRDFVSRLLTASGYNVITAETGEDALRKSREHNERIPNGKQIHAARA